MSTQATSGTGEKPKYYYYYPAFNKKYHRRVLAGLVVDGKIIVSEAVCFPGKKGDPGAEYKLELLSEMIEAGTIGVEDAYLHSPAIGMKADQFIKTRGREIAEKRAIKALTFEGGLDEYNNPLQDPAVLRIDIPTDCKSIGKLFVEEVEKVYPKTAPKKRKAKGEPAPAQA